MILIRAKLTRLQLSIIIVNYNVKYFLEQCLHSLKPALKNMDAEVIVVDNASADGSCTFIKQHFPWVKLIELPKNIGFGRANNVGLKQAAGKLILFLNPDTILSENVLTSAITFLEKQAGAAASGLRMIDGSGSFLPESKRSFPTPLNSFFKLSGLASVFPKSKKINRYALGNIPEHSIAEVEVLSGAFFLCSKAILEQAGGFDEDFFMYGEDIDLSYRIQKQGNKVFYLGSTSILHFKGESSKDKNLQYVKMFYGAMEKFIKKHYRKNGKRGLSDVLKFGVYAAGFLSVAKSYASRIFKKRGEEKLKSFTLTGDPEGMKEAEQIIRSVAFDARIRRVEIHEINAVKSNIVFCTGRLSYQEAIRFMDEHKHRFRYFLHGLNSTSIVGSASKNDSGIVLSQVSKL